MNKALATLFLSLVVAGANSAAEKPAILLTRHPKQAASEAALAAVRRSDSTARDAQGNISKLTPQEHMRRANVYNSNRAFVEARAHWQALLNYYPNDPRVPEALLGLAKSYF